MLLTGFERPGHRQGIRNHLAVVPTSVCAATVAQRIAAAVPAAVALPHQHGCCQMGSDHAQTVRTLSGCATNPNIAAVLVVELGCEGIPAAQLASEVEALGTPVRCLSIQGAGGTAAATATGIATLHELVEQVDDPQRQSMLPQRLIVGLECGGSDATSGLIANPVVGLVTDQLVALGATVILSETTEMIGAEHLLAARASDPAIGDRLLACVQAMEERALAMGNDIRGSQPTPGNIAGGITTIEEKSLGCIHKAGSAPLMGVLDYGQAPSGPGLWFMDTPGQDIESITGMVAGGAQIILFTTGRGTPTGCPIAPVIKITGNHDTALAMPDCIDVDAGRVISEGLSPQELADELLAVLTATINGQPVLAEIHGHQEFAINRIGPTL